MLRTVRVAAAATTTAAAWVLVALVIPAGGLRELRRDVQNGIDWLNVIGWKPNAGYAGDLRSLAEAVGVHLRTQAIGAAAGLLIAIVAIAIAASRSQARSALQPPARGRPLVVAVATGAVLGGALAAALAHGDLHSGYRANYPVPDFAPSLVALALWGTSGRVIGVAIAEVSERLRGRRTIASQPLTVGTVDAHPEGSPTAGWMIRTFTLVGLAVASGLGSSNELSYQIHVGSNLLVAALVCIVSRLTLEERAVTDSQRVMPTQMFAGAVCVVLGALALRWTLEARADPYRQLPLSASTASFSSVATGVTVHLPRSQGRGLEQIERQARRAGWRSGTSLLDITPFHPFVTFWLGADPPFNVYPAVDEQHATKALLETINRESEDHLRSAWLLVSAPLRSNIDYPAISRALGRSWPCGYEPVANANLGPSFSYFTPSPVRVVLLRPVASPVPRTCAASPTTSETLTTPPST